MITLAGPLSLPLFSWEKKVVWKQRKILPAGRCDCIMSGSFKATSMGGNTGGRGTRAEKMSRLLRRPLIVNLMAILTIGPDTCKSHDPSNQGDSTDLGDSQDFRLCTPYAISTAREWPPFIKNTCLKIPESDLNALFSFLFFPQF